MRLIEPLLYLRFAQEYVRDYDAQGAGRRLNLRPGQANSLMINPDVRAHIIRLSEGQLRAADITAGRVMLQMARLAFADRGGLQDEKGNLRALADIPEDLRACVVGVKAERMTTRIGVGLDGEPVSETTQVIDYKLEKPSTTLAMLAKHFKLIDSETDGVNALASALADRLASARQRRRNQDAEDVTPRAAAPLLANASPEVVEGIYRDVLDLEMPDLG